MHTEKWAPLAAILAAVCYMDVAPVVETLRTLGLGALLREMVLLPSLVLFLAATLWALTSDRRYHRSPGPGRVAWAGAPLTLGGVWVSDPVAVAGLVLLAGAAAWNWRLIRSLDDRRARARRVRKG